MMLEVYVSKENFKFNCAHFIAYRGYRERLHGHNYRVGVRLKGTRIGEEGYLIDFGDVKEATRALCSELNEYFLCPMNSDVIRISTIDSNLCLQCEDGTMFSFPTGDCKMLPLRHTSAEEISHYIYCSLVRKIGYDKLHGRGVHYMEVDVSEAEKQTAIFGHSLPTNEEELIVIENGLYPPAPCISSN